MWIEVGWSLISVALWVDDWNNAERNFGMRKSGTAGASIVTASHGKEVFICQVVTMAGGLNVFNHKSVLWAQWLHHSLHLSLMRSFVSDSSEIKIESSVFKLCMSGSNSTLAAASQNKSSIEIVVISTDGKNLFNLKAHIGKSNIAIFVIKINMSSASFMRFEEILIKQHFDF